jgi:hypothetical protein
MVRAGKHGGCFVGKEFSGFGKFIPRVLRSSSFSPTSSSRSWICRLNAGWAMRSLFAAWVTLRTSATAAK